MIRAIAVGVVCLVSAGARAEGGCRNDMDCKGDRICEAGQCVDPKRATPARETVSETPPADALEKPSAPPSSANFHINALGILQLGLTPSFELGGRNLSWVTRVRLLNTGVLSYVLLPGSEDEDYFSWGLGVGTGLRFWPVSTSTMQGFYLGLGSEWVYTRVVDDTDDRAEYLTHTLVPYLELGYRWYFGRFLLGVGVLGGGAIPVAYSDEPVGFGGCVYANSCQEERSAFFFGMLTLDLGFTL